jgi:hypothetical protein
MSPHQEGYETFQRNPYADIAATNPHRGQDLSSSLGFLEGWQQAEEEYLEQKLHLAEFPAELDALCARCPRHLGTWRSFSYATPPASSPDQTGPLISSIVREELR